MVKQVRHLALWLALSAACAPALQAQVKFNLSLLPDNRTYLVSVLPETTWPVPFNMVGSVQIVIKKAADRPFMAGELTSLVPNVTWWDNTYVESPESAPEHDFVCIVMRERGVKDIVFNAWVETPLFTFVNLFPNCAGPLELVENDDPMVQAVVNVDRINITQNMSVLGAQGNAFSGVLNGTADCTVATSVDDPESPVRNLRVFPVPADLRLQVFWENTPGMEVDKLIVSNAAGQVLAVRKVAAMSGEQNIELDIKDLPAGVYSGALLAANGTRQAFRFIVVRM
ncbi:MAG: hypothetical protein KF852_00160 [Saprospiraceae bacterium]|nr:hypothetical protein [Saprospiraceae bacterium]